MPEPKPSHCQQCGSRLSTLDARGLCPQCLVKLGLIFALDDRQPPLGAASDQASRHRLPSRDDSLLAPGATAPAPPAAIVGRIGGYELIEEIGRGGMGVVYRAYQAGLKRAVAIKMILSGEYASNAAIRRFRSEAEAAAGLRHPNIVAIHEIGEFNGRPFFSMDLVQGQSLAELGRDGRMPPSRVARYTQAIALAIQYAHSQGILHRDLKPSNVLVDQDDQPQLTDFGLAKRLLEDSELTLSGQLLGSPNFMAPEQASRRQGSVDARSDVYAIGATLYYLLTGRPPFFAGSVADTLNELLQREPLPPALLNSTVPLDLQTICLKCLEKEPGRRYQSAQELAEDLQRFLESRPILARPISRAESLWKWCRRKPVLASLSAAVLTLVLSIAIGSAIALNRIRHERDRAAQLLYVSDLNLAFHALRENRFGRVRELLERHRPAAGQPDLRGWEWGHLWQESQSDELRSLSGHSATVNALAFSPDGSWLASGSNDQTVRIWQVPSLEPIASLPHQGRVLALAFSPDGQRLLTAEEQTDTEHSTVRCWDAGSWRETRSFSQADTVEGLATDPSGKLLAITAKGGRVMLHDLNTLEVLARPDSGCPQWKMSTPPVFAPGRPLLAVALPDAVNLFDTERFRVTHTIPSSSFSLFRLDVAFAPDGRLFAVGGSSPRLFDCTTTPIPQNLDWSASEVRCVAFSPKGNRFATGHADRTIGVWDTTHWSRWATLKGHWSAPTRLAFSSDGCLLASLDDTPEIKIWDMKSPPPGRPTIARDDPDARPHYSLGPAVLYQLPNRTIEVQTGLPDIQLTRRQLPFEPGEWLFVSPQGNRIAVSDPETNLVFFDVDSMQPLLRFPMPGHWFWPYRLFSPDGTRFSGTDLASGAHVVWRVADGRELARQRVHPYALRWWLRDCRTLLLSHPNGADVWDSQEDVIRGRLAETGGILAAVLSRDGSLLATVGPESVVRVWDARTLRPLRAFARGEPLHGSHTLVPFDFSPDNRRLAVVAGRTELTLYDLKTGKEVGTPVIPGVAPVGCGFSDDGHWLLAVIPRFGSAQMGIICLQSAAPVTPPP